MTIDDTITESRSDPALVRTKIRGHESPEDFLEMAREVREGGDSGLELSILEKAAGKYPDSPDVLTAYADGLIEGARSEPSVLEKGDFFREAAVYWDRALGISAAFVPALLSKGRFLTMMAYRSGDDPRNGMKLLNDVLRLKPGGRPKTEAEFYLGMGFRRLGDEPKARHQFEKAIQLDPSFMPAHLASQC